MTGWPWRKTGLPRQALLSLEYQGSDSFLKKQFKYCAKGEIGYFAPKHIVSALPEEGERPTKSHRKFTIDGFEKEEEEEERPNPQTRRQLERMHTVFRNNLLMCMLAGSTDLRLLVGNHLPLRLPSCGQSGMHGAKCAN